MDGHTKVDVPRHIQKGMLRELVKLSGSNLAHQQEISRSPPNSVGMLFMQDHFYMNTDKPLELAAFAAFGGLMWEQMHNDPNQALPAAVLTTFATQVSRLRPINDEQRDLLAAWRAFLDEGSIYNTTVKPKDLEPLRRIRRSTIPELVSGLEHKGVIRKRGDGYVVVF